MDAQVIKADRAVRFFLSLALFCNIAFWFLVRGEQARWTNIPPAPDKHFAASYALGDAELSYRIIGLMIQNMGDYGGRTTSLADYDYHALAKWLFLEDFLDPHSDYVPYLAGYYFGSVQKPEEFRPVLGYLETIGRRPEGEKWRWLLQAIWITRFKLGDLDRAIELSYELARVNNPNLPEWAHQMPAFVMNAKGEKEAAYALMLQLLKTRGDRMDPTEVNAMRGYICEQILSKQEAELNPLCKKLP
ncbi:MAG: hypothetical protein KDI13_03335 [Alphaproteobacteria bacterium]|nr:hypothetical protein [Alphaproteobacteria bacterium]